MAHYPQERAQDAVCQSHTGQMTGLWFLPTRPLRLNTNEWLKGGQCLGLSTLPPSCADCFEIWKPLPPGTFRDPPGLSWDCFTFLVNSALYDPTRCWKRVCHHIEYLSLKRNSVIEIMTVRSSGQIASRAVRIQHTVYYTTGTYKKTGNQSGYGICKYQYLTYCHFYGDRTN